MKELFDQLSIRCSRLTTKAYSTSFTWGIRCLGKELRDPVYSIYGFVRFADEIVDSFHEYDKASLLRKFREDTYRSIDDGISLNPILNSFQHTVKRYKIDHRLIEQFLRSMEMDLQKQDFTTEEFKEYILGSAEVVGLMCLRIFCDRNEDLYNQLKPYAMSLGSAFQKINFLRDLRADFTLLGRTYFPDIDMREFNDSCKRGIEEEIERDFRKGYYGIKRLPRTARFGVYVCYVYYLALFEKIRNIPSEHVLQSRIRIANHNKAWLLASSYLKHQLNLI